MTHPVIHPVTKSILKRLLFGLCALLLTLYTGGALQAQTPTAAPFPAASEQALFKIGGDLVVTPSQTVTDAFAVGGDVALQAGTQLPGDVFAIGGSVRLEEGVEVQGDAFAVGGRLIKAPDAVVRGSEFTVLEQLGGLFQRFGIFGTLYLANGLFWLAAFVVAAIAGCGLLLLLPKQVVVIRATLTAQPMTSFLYGIGGLVALSILTVLIAGSVLGSLLLPVANLALVLTGLLGWSAFCLWTGTQLWRTPSQSRFRQFFSGLLLLWLISLLPVVGGLLLAFASLFGFGATLLARYGTRALPPTLAEAPQDREVAAENLAGIGHS